MRRVAILAVILLLASSVPGSGGSGKRDEALPTGAAVDDVAVAYAPVSGAGAVAAATQDPAAGSPAGDVVEPGGITDPDLASWFLWDGDGDQVWAGHADRPDCGTRLQDDCVSPAVAASLSDDGTHLVVVSEVEASTATLTPDDGRTLIMVATSAAGVILRDTVPYPPVDVAVSGDGTRIALLARDERPTGAVGVVYIWSWPGASDTSFTSTLTLVAGEALNGDAHTLAFDPLGRELAVAGDRYWHFSGVTAGTTEDTTTSTTPAATDVAVSGGSSPWSVVGYEDGAVFVYPATTSGAGKCKAFGRGVGAGNTDISAVAISRNASVVVAGDLDGRLHFFRNTPGGATPCTTPSGAFVASFAVGSGAVRDLRVSTDGRIVAYRTASEVRMHLWDPATKTLGLLWKDAPGAVTGLGMTGDGDLVAAAVGSQVVVYDALHDIAAVVPASVPASPGHNATAELKYRNDGNRPSQATLTVVGAPAGWTVGLAPTSIDLLPDQDATVVLAASVPASHPPGPATVTVDHAIGGTKEGSTTVTFDVPRVDDLRLAATGSRSLPVDPGAPAAFMLKATNTGNVHADAKLDVTGAGAGWGVTVAPPTRPLAPGASATFEVQVQAPADVPDGTSRSFRASLADVPGQEVDLTVTVGAHFEIGLEAPSSVAARLGNQTHFDVTVHNRGNAPDTVDLKIGEVPGVVVFPNGQDAWVVPDLAPGASAIVEVRVLVEDALGASKIRFDMTATSRADPSVAAGRNIQIALEGALECPEGKELKDGECVKDTPGLGLGLVVALLAAGAWVARRRR